MFEMPDPNNPLFSDSSIETSCCIEYCDLQTCKELDLEPPCENGGVWHSWLKNCNI